MGKDGKSWKERLWVDLLGVAPLRAYTAVVGAVGACPLPGRVRAPVWRGLARALKIDLGEAELPLGAYRSFRDLFMRRLRPGLRPIDETPLAVVSPVDGCVTMAGAISGETLIQAKGLDFTVSDLLGNADVARRFDNGFYLVLYLRPKDYHRVHAPVSGVIEHQYRIPGRLLPVKPAVVRQRRGLFVRNERVVLTLSRTVCGEVGVVCVGAAAVRAIAMPHEGNGGGVHLHKGDELAAFRIGSTVILLFQAGRVALSSLQSGDEVRVGQPLAYVLKPDSGQR